MTAPISQSVDTLAARTSTAPFITVIKDRPPTTLDGINNAYQVGQRWVDTSNNNAEWFLLNFASANGSVTAHWVELAFGAGTVETLTGNTGGAVFPDSADNINLLGDSSGIQFAGSPSTHTLTGTLANIPNSSLANSSIGLIAGSGINISVSPVSLGGSTTISATNAGDIQTLTDDVGTTITPTSGNIQIVGHIVEQGATKFSTVVAGTNIANINPMASARWIVDPLGFNGTHTTISAALSSATSGDTIFLLPGTYTENPTLKAGVNICANTCDALTPNVSIVGTCTFTGSGTVSISGIQLQTNSAPLLSVTGSAASVVNLSNCYLNCTNNSGIVLSSSNSGASISIIDSQGDTGTTGINFFTVTNAGTLNIFTSDITNSGGTTTASTASSGGLFFRRSLFNSPISITGSAQFVNIYTNFATRLSNVIAITLASSGAQQLYSCLIQSGSASAVKINSGALFIANSVIQSSNTNVLTGAGTANSGGNVCINSSGQNVSTYNSLTVI